MSDQKKRSVTRRDALKTLLAAPGLLLIHCSAGADLSDANIGRAAIENPDVEHYWAYAVDTTKCIGCNACMRACQAENNVPEGYFRTWVERYRVNEDGDLHIDVAKDGNHVFEPLEGDVAKAFFVPKLCNHCERSVCTQVCPVGASYATDDGVVLVDKEQCIGCGYCVQACPYSTRFINPETHLADKCTLCYHRITEGLLPACVQACPTGARLFGDLKDPHGKLSTILRQRRYRLLLPEMGTHPKCYYLGLDREVI